MPPAGSVAQHLRPPDLPIIAGVILSAVGTDYLIAHPGQHLSPGQAAVTLAGPIVYLAGELGFRQRMIHRRNPKRVLVIVVLLSPLSSPP
jgi:low temperature requirement protein LtrA